MRPSASRARRSRRSVREIVHAWLKITPRGKLLALLYQPRPGHLNWPPGYKIRLANRHALGPEPES